MVKYTVSVSNLFLFSSFSWVFASAASVFGDALFLSPYIEKGEFELARNLSNVLPLIGNVQSHSGFVRISNECGSEMFFWYFKNINPNAPIVVWLQGGPGESSLRGIFSEVGPYRITLENKLEENKYTWVREVSMIFFDNPVGTGYSLSGRGRCFPKDHSKIGKDLLVALKQVLSIFPYETNNPVYIAGQGFGGKFATALAHAIHSYERERINLQGLAIGNPVIEPEIQFQHSDFLYGLGLVDSDAGSKLKKEEDRCQYLIRQKNWQEAFYCLDETFLGFVAPTTTFTKLTGYTSYYNCYFSDPQPEGNWHAFINSAKVRKLTHAGPIIFDQFEDVVTNFTEIIPQSIKPMLEELLKYYNVLVYSGQLDILSPYPLTEKFLKTLNWPGAEEYKNARSRKWHIGRFLVGYVKVARNLVDVVVRNSGSMVPRDAAVAAFDMISKFFNNKPFF